MRDAIIIAVVSLLIGVGAGAVRGLYSYTTALRSELITERALSARYRHSAEYYAGIVERCGFYVDPNESMTEEE